MKVFMFNDGTAQFWHRGFLPCRNLAPLLIHDGITLEMGSEPTWDYDLYVFQRKPSRLILQWVRQLKAAGKKIVWDVDDDVWHLPEWNPAYQSYKDTSAVDMLRDIADEVWVSTEHLQKVVGRGQVLPNLIDPYYWPDFEKPANDKLRILWAGSAYHSPDVEIVADVFETLLKCNPDIICLFFGCFPESMAEWVRLPGSNHARMVPHPRYERRVGFIQPVPIEQYGQTLCAINADIALAALVNEPFSYSKSSLKWLEYSMAGVPTVASGLPPYLGTTALVEDLLGDTASLIENAQERVELGQRSKELVEKEYLWTEEKKDLWLTAIQSFA